MQSGADETLEVKLFNDRPYFSLLPSPLSPGERRIRRLAQEDLIQRLFQEGLNGWDYWGPKVIIAVQRLGSVDLGKASDANLADHLENTLGTVRRHWVVHANIWSSAWAPLCEAYTVLTGLPR